MGDQKKLFHIKYKNKISYLGEKNSILPWQMAEQLAVEVDVKNVTERGKNWNKCLCKKAFFDHLAHWRVKKNCTTLNTFRYGDMV